MDLFLFKLIAVIIILAIGLAFGRLPLRFEQSRSGLQSLVYGDAFSAGIFLGAALMHMLPDAQENFAAVSAFVGYPLSGLVCGLGFLLLLFLEQGLSKAHKGVSDEESFTPYLLVIVLSIHSVIAGTTFGLEDVAISSLAIFIAIVSHKGAAAFALGNNLVENGYSGEKYLRLIFVFAIMTPIGIGMGAVFNQVLTSQDARLVEAIFDAFAAGTFLFVGIVEIMGGLFGKPGSIWFKLILMLAGFFLMALIAVWV